MQSQRLTAIIDDVERRLAAFYGFAPQSRAAAHVVTREELRTSLGDRIRTLPEFHGRAGVFLAFDDAEDNLYIGIHFADEIRSRLEAVDPTVRLSEQNLDAFCVLIEEISHFHLILNRTDLGVSKLELEWQGEIDKLLICAELLATQSGNDHLAALARRLFDTADIVAEDHELYWEATRYAARFWFQAVREGHLSPRLKQLLRRSYQAAWADKLALLESPVLSRAS